jgi:DNA-binding CsgD family transcriptional regulator
VTKNKRLKSNFMKTETLHNGNSLENFNGQFHKLIDPMPDATHKKNITLSEREIQVLQFLANGYSTLELSEAIFVSPYTIDSHRKNIVRKMGVRNISHAITEALRNKLIK